MAHGQQLQREFLFFPFAQKHVEITGIPLFLFEFLKNIIIFSGEISVQLIRSDAYSLTGITGAPGLTR